MTNENKIQLLYTMYCVSCTEERIANGEQLDLDEYLTTLSDLETIINQKGIENELGQDAPKPHESDTYQGGQLSR